MKRDGGDAFGKICIGPWCSGASIKGLLSCQQREGGYEQMELYSIRKSVVFWVGVDTCLLFTSGK